MRQRPVNRFAIALIMIASLNSVGVNRSRLEAEQQGGGWCYYACGLGAFACCALTEVLCEACGLGFEPCVAYCALKFPGGA